MRRRVPRGRGVGSARELQVEEKPLRLPLVCQLFTVPTPPATPLLRSQRDLQPSPGAIAGFVCGGGSGGAVGEEGVGVEASEGPCSLEERHFSQKLFY